jgi:hypothetical protein
VNYIQRAHTRLVIVNKRSTILEAFLQNSSSERMTELELGL